MEYAHKRGSVLSQKFWFRKDISTNSSDDYELMTIDTIINGSQQFVGILPLIRKYVSGLKIDDQSSAVLDKYLKLIAGRANGSLKTTAAWIRHFVRSHPDYKQDSIVSQSITYDLCKTVISIEKGLLKDTSLLGDLYSVSKANL